MNELYSVKWIICVASASFEFRIFSTILTFFFGIEWNLISIRHPNRIRTLICAIIKHEYILHNAHKQRNMIRIRQIIPNSKKWKRFFFLHCAQILTEVTSAMTFSSHKEPRLTLDRFALWIKKKTDWEYGWFRAYFSNGTKIIRVSVRVQWYVWTTF